VVGGGKQVTREEFGKIAAALKAVYTDPKFLPDTHAIDVWYGFLKDLSNAQCQAAVSKYVATRRFAPTIAEIREMAVDNTRFGIESTMSALEAWSLVRKALRNGLYGSEEEWEKLPEICQRALGSPANIREMAQLDTSQVETVEQSHFVRAYNNVLVQMRDEAKIPPNIHRLITSVRGESLAAIEMADGE
jgi:hypothetical protein